MPAMSGTTIQQAEHAFDPAFDLDRLETESASIEDLARVVRRFSTSTFATMFSIVDIWTWRTCISCLRLVRRWREVLQINSQIPLDLLSEREAESMYQSMEKAAQNLCDLEAGWRERPMDNFLLRHVETRLADLREEMHDLLECWLLVLDPELSELLLRRIADSQNVAISRNP